MGPLGGRRGKAARGASGTRPTRRDVLAMAAFGAVAGAGGSQKAALASQDPPNAHLCDACAGRADLVPIRGGAQVSHRRGSGRRRVASGIRCGTRRAAHLCDACVGRADLVRSGGDAGDHHPVHGALRAARRDGEADAGQAAGAVPGGIVDRVDRRQKLRVRHPQGRSNSTTATRSPPTTSSSRSSATRARRTI